MGLNIFFYTFVVVMQYLNMFAKIIIYDDVIV